MKRFWAAVAASGFLVFAQGAQAQITVVDWPAIANMLKQIEEAKAQLLQLQQTHQALTHMTDVSSIRALLADPKIKSALPQSGAGIEQQLMGTGSAAGGGSTTAKSDQLFAIAGDNYYAESMARAQQINGGSKDMAQSVLDSAGALQTAISAIQDQLAGSPDVKTTADLHAQMSGLQATAQVQLIQLNALRMLADAEVRTRDARDAQLFTKVHADAVKAAGSQ